MEQNFSITGRTGLTGLLGSPVAHSLSPLMHNEAFRQLGLDYVYLCFDVKEAKLETAVQGLKACGIRGFNLTMPDKNRMAELADELSPAASIIGAVNTVVNENGRLIGHNTDGTGFMRSVADAGLSIQGASMTIFGAGGASTAICAQAALDGAKNLYIFCTPLQPLPSAHPEARGYDQPLHRLPRCSLRSGRPRRAERSPGGKQPAGQRHLGGHGSRHRPFHPGGCLSAPPGTDRSRHHLQPAGDPLSPTGKGSRLPHLQRHVHASLPGRGSFPPLDRTGYAGGTDPGKILFTVLNRGKYAARTSPYHEKCRRHEVCGTFLYFYDSLSSL